MKIFIESYSTIIYFCILALTCVVALFCHKKYKTTIVKYFIYFMVYTFFVELVALTPLMFYKLGKVDEIRGTFLYSNHWWYTLFWNIGSTVFYVFYYSKILKGKRFKQFLKYMLYVFLVYAAVLIVSDIEYFKMHTYRSVQVINMVIVICCVAFYFIEILNDDRVIEFYKSINFYFSSVILIWWLLASPFVFYQEFYNGVDEHFMVIQTIMFFLLNSFMYLSFSLAFLCCKTETI